MVPLAKRTHRSRCGPASGTALHRRRVASTALSTLHHGKYGMIVFEGHAAVCGPASSPRKQVWWWHVADLMFRGWVYWLRDFGAKKVRSKIVQG